MQGAKSSACDCQCYRAQAAVTERARACGGQKAFLILRSTSSRSSSMKIALLGSLLLIFSCPCRILQIIIHNQHPITRYIAMHMHQQHGSGMTAFCAQPTSTVVSKESIDAPGKPGFL